MMCIAWTAFFHAYCLKNKIKPWYRKKELGKKPRFEYITEKLPDGTLIKDKKWWELNRCINEFFKEKPDTAVQKNIEFLSGLRNLIVHRNLPELDASIFAECQACILNFNNYLKKYFSDKQDLSNLLSFSIQIFNNAKNFLEASNKELKNKNATEVVDFIKSFRSSLSTQILESSEYSFKAVLFQVKNHESKDALALKFIHEKDLTDEQKEQLGNMGIVLIKEKQSFLDGVPSDYIYTYECLLNELKNNISEFKRNKNFHQIKKRILEKNPKLKYTRHLDPNNSKSSKKDYYHKEIINEFKKVYSETT